MTTSLKINLKYVAAIAVAILMSVVIFSAPVQKVQAETTQDAATAEIIELLLAQLAALQEQLLTLLQGGAIDGNQGIGSTVSRCNYFTKSLYIGASDTTTGGEVSELQEYLTSTGDYTYGKLTGYFGPSTMAAVKKWQARNGVVSYGTPDSTGYGLVGTKTRAALNKRCSDYIPPTMPPEVEIEPATIDLIEAKAAEDGVLYAGEKAYIHGENLEGYLKVKLGNIEPKYVKATSVSDTYAWFIVPEYSQNIQLSIQVKNNSGEYSDFYSVQIEVVEDNRFEISKIETLGYAFDEREYDPTLKGEVELNDEDRVKVWFEWTDDIDRLERDSDTFYGLDYSNPIYVDESGEVNTLATTKGGFIEGRKYYYRINASGSTGRIRGDIEYFQVEEDKVIANITSISNSLSPQVEGTAYGTDIVGFSIGSEYGDKVYGSGDIEVEDNKWIHKVNETLEYDEPYSLTLYVENEEMDKEEFTVIDSSSQILAVDLRINGQDGPLNLEPVEVEISWESQGATDCLASGSGYWGGDKKTSGTETIDLNDGKDLYEKVYRIVCSDEYGREVSDVITVYIITDNDTGCYYEPYDYNDDGKVNSGDIDILTGTYFYNDACPIGKICDINSDGTVDLLDALELADVFVGKIACPAVLGAATTNSNLASVIIGVEELIESIRDFLK